MGKKTFAAGFTAVALSALLAGCGGGSNPAGPLMSNGAQGTPGAVQGTNPYGGVTTLGAAAFVKGLVENGGIADIPQSVTLLDKGANPLVVTTNGQVTSPNSWFSTDGSFAITVSAHAPGIACPMSGSGTGNFSDSKTVVTITCAPGTMNTEAMLSSATTGSQPEAGLVSDGHGNFYGVTMLGGAYSHGTVFKINASGVVSVLHSFAGGTDGAQPEGDLVMDAAGNIYGTTLLGGHTGPSTAAPSGNGTVFKIDAQGNYSQVYAFNGGTTDGSMPSGGVAFANANTLVGVTQTNGAFGGGTAYAINIGVAPATERLLWSFGSTGDGSAPIGDLLVRGGTIYGATQMGGAGNQGTVFTLPVAGGSNVVLHSFAGGTDGAMPLGGLSADAQGNLYGTTESGGNKNGGTIFKYDTKGAYSVLYNFGTAAGDGTAPRGALTVDTNGVLYGTASSGGAKGQGALFAFNPASTSGSDEVLYAFGATATDGQAPYGGVSIDSMGNLWGTTSGGGDASGDGTIFLMN